MAYKVQDLLFSFNTVFPLLVMMMAGFGARRLGWLSDSATRQINNCVFRLFLPLLLCYNILDTDPGAAVDGKALLFAGVACVTMFLLLFWLIPRVVKDHQSRGVMIQGICRSNYAIFGIPLVLMMYPDADASVAVMMVLVAVPIFNILSTVALMLYSKEAVSAWRIIKGVLLNPLILGTATGFLLWKLGVQIPAVLDTPFRKLGSIATPLSLFLLGASLDFGKAKANRVLLSWSVVGRLVLVPLVCLSAALLLGIRDVALAAMIALFASPTAVSSYPMAQQMGGDDALAAGQVVFTTVFSVVTVFLWVFALKALSFL